MIEELIRGVIQISGAVLGAVSLWGGVLMLRDRLSEKRNPHLMELINRMMFLFIPALITFLISWWYCALVLFPINTFAHEGIVIKPTLSAIQNGFAFGLPLVGMLMLSSIIMLSLYLGERMNRHKKFQKWGVLLFLSQFLITFLIMFVTMLFIVWTGSWNKDQFFFGLHSIHSIFTLGTVLTVDFLYIISQHHSEIKKIVYRFFPVMSAAIWIGLGIDFLSVTLIFNEGFRITSQLLFTQTVVGILVLNGALLSGKITETLNKLIHTDRVVSLSPRNRFLFSVSGAISITSWLIIYILDFLRFEFKYIEFLLIYLWLVIGMFFIHRFLDATAFKKI